MNLVSITVSGALVGMLSPFIASMSIQPVMAQKRASNFSAAEAVAVSYSAKNELLEELTEVPTGCSVILLEARAYTISCFQGVGKFRMNASRSFRLLSPLPLTDDGNNGHGNDIDGIDESNPGNSRVYCPYYDVLGEMKGNKGCISPTTNMAT